MHDLLGENATWRDVLYYVRAEKVDDDAYDLEVVGEGSSRTLKRTKKDGGGTEFIKEVEPMWDIEKLKENREDFFNKLIEETENGEVFYETLKRKATPEQIASVMDYFLNIDKQRGAWRMFDANRKKKDGETYLEFFSREFDTNYKEEETRRTLEMIKSCAQEGEAVAKAIIELRALRNRKVTEHSAGTRSARISAGSEIALRNAATYIVANSLGYGHLVARSVPIMLTKRDAQKRKTRVKANAMEGVGGREMKKVDDDASGVEFTPASQLQLNVLRMLDAVCGQIDRHRGNYMVTTTELPGTAQSSKNKKPRYRIESVVGIDNDLAFGELTYEELRTGSNLENLKNLTRSNIRYLPHAFVERLRFYADNEGLLGSMLQHILKKEEIDAMEGRLRGLVEEINAAEQNGTLLLVHEDNEEEMRNGFEKK